MSERPMLDRLAELDADVERAEAAAADAERALRESTADLTALAARRAEHDRQVGAGEREPDPAFEDKADRRLGAPGLVRRRRTPHGRTSYEVIVDQRLEQRLEGARNAAEAARDRREEHARAHLPQLAAEAAAGARADQEAAVEALGALEDALEPVAARDALLLSVHRLAGAPPPGPAPFADLRHAVSLQRAALRGARLEPGFEPHPPGECERCGGDLPDEHLVGLDLAPLCDGCVEELEGATEPGEAA